MDRSMVENFFDMEANKNAKTDKAQPVRKVPKPIGKYSKRRGTATKTISPFVIQADLMEELQELDDINKGPQQDANFVVKMGTRRTPAPQPLPDRVDLFAHDVPATPAEKFSEDKEAILKNATSLEQAITNMEEPIGDLITYLQTQFPCKVKMIYKEHRETLQKLARQAFSGNSDIFELLQEMTDQTRSFKKEDIRGASKLAASLKSMLPECENIKNGYSDLTKKKLQGQNGSRIELYNTITKMVEEMSRSREILERMHGRIKKEIAKLSIDRT